MHRPSQFTLEANIVIPNVVNRYSKTFLKDFKYVSDSHHNWREDVVLAAMHRIPIGDEQYINSNEITNSNKEEIFKCIEEATFNALKNSSVDILAHPFQFGENKQYISFFSTKYCNNLRCHAIQCSKCIEFNYSKYNGCVQQDYWKFPNFKVWVGSDSHSIIDLKNNTNTLKKTYLFN